MKHYPVLKNEVLNYLNIKSDGIYVDGTLGFAGISSNILKQLNSGKLYAFDKDIEAINYSNNVLKNINSNFKIFHADFSKMQTFLEKEGVNCVDGIVLDLGVSSPQIDTPERGFSYLSDGKLDMRMDQSSKLNAYDVVNTYSKETLTDIFYKYGEEKLSKVIASEIVKTRINKPITTTLELTEVIKESVGAKYFYKNHPERQIFQALRIYVNHELESLETVLPIAIDLLKKGGRLCVITFHSLEDRLTKQIFKNYSEVNPLVKGLPDIPKNYQPKIKLINKKPIIATNEEINENSRSKSAKLRVVERI